MKTERTSIKNNPGNHNFNFTLIELLVVIAIIAISEGAGGRRSGEAVGISGGTDPCGVRAYGKGASAPAHPD